MEKANINLFAQNMDRLKYCHAPVIHNIFQSATELEDIMDEKECLLSPYERTLILLVPRHRSFYEMLYASADTHSLKEDLAVFLDAYSGPLNLRASIIGREKQTAPVVECFAGSGFSLGRKIARMRNHFDINNLEKQIKEMCESQLADEMDFEIDFARPGDEKAVLDLLREEFDQRSDNLPELAEIAQNIDKGQVIVIRKNDKIIALHYFTMQNSMAYGWYDVIQKAYRRQHLYLYMMRFQYKFWKDRDDPVRSYSWRDVNNKRLMALAARSNQLPDGVYIYNMLLDFPKASAEGCDA